MRRSSSAFKGPHGHGAVRRSRLWVAAHFMVCWNGTRAANCGPDAASYTTTARATCRLFLRLLQAPARSAVLLPQGGG